MSFKKTLALCLSLLILGGCAITGTLAFPNFLSDSPAQDQNPPEQVLQIALKIEEDENALLVPAVPFTKKVSIENKVDSTESAYVWYTYAVPEALLGEDGKRPLTVQLSNDGWEYLEEGNRIFHNGMDYVQFTCLYTSALEPNEVTMVGMESATLDARVGRDENGNYIWVENGISTPIGYNEDTIEIPFHAYAIGVESFENVTEAYNAYNSNISSPTAEATAG